MKTIAKTIIISLAFCSPQALFAEEYNGLSAHREDAIQQQRESQREKDSINSQLKNFGGETGPDIKIGVSEDAYDAYYIVVDKILKVPPETQGAIIVKLYDFYNDPTVEKIENIKNSLPRESSQAFSRLVASKNNLARDGSLDLGKAKNTVGNILRTIEAKIKKR